MMLKHRSSHLHTRPAPIESVVEREIKLSVESDFWLSDLSGHPLPRRAFTSTYFHTLDHCLARSTITLRFRKEGRSGAWQLKLPLNGARREIEAQGAAGAGMIEDGEE